MRLGVLSSSATGPDGTTSAWHLEDLARAANDRQIELVPLDWRALAAGVGAVGAGLRCGEVDLGELDALLVRAMPAGGLEQVVYRMDALGRIEAAGVPVINPPRAIECAVDKYLALARIAAAGLGVPETRVAERTDAALADFDALGGDVVIKPLFGSLGRGVMRVSAPELALRAFRTLERLGAVIYQQRFVDHGGRDLRALIAGDRVVAAMHRLAPTARPGTADAGPAGDTTGWKTNIASGGRAERHELAKDEAELALAASRAVGTEIAGVDLVRDREGRLLVLEVNSAPGWRALANVTGVDIAREVLEHARRVAGGER